MKISDQIKNHQQTIVLAIGYLLVAGICFGIGRISAQEIKPPEIRIEESLPLPNNTQNIPETQSAPVNKPAPDAQGECSGKIKGNINSKGEKIYHLPTGSFYARTQAEACFVTESEAQAAGFRRSSR